MRVKDFRNGFLPCIIIIGLMMSLIIIQPDFSTALIIGSIGTIILFIGGAKIKHLIASSFLGFIISIPIIYFKPYRLARILSFFDKSDITENGYQAHQALLSLGNGGLFGVGLGNSVKKTTSSYSAYRFYFFNYRRRAGTAIWYVTTLSYIFIYIF